MTTAEPKQLAKDVAKQIDRRRMRRKLFVLAAIVAAIVLAITYLTCGRGWGLGGTGKGAGSGPGPGSGGQVTIDAGAARCAVRVTATGNTVDGKPATRDEVVTACRATTGADVVVTGDARQGDWDELRTALEAAGVVIYMKQK